MTEQDAITEAVERAERRAALDAQYRAEARAILSRIVGRKYWQDAKPPEGAAP